MNSLVGLSFNETEICDVSIQSTFPQNLIFLAWTKGNSKTHHKTFFSLLFASSTTPFATITLWSSCILSKKALFLLSITPSKTTLSLLAKILARILYIHPINEIGLKSHRFCLSSIFRTRVMKDKLHPLSMTPLA